MFSLDSNARAEPGMFGCSVDPATTGTTSLFCFSKTNGIRLGKLKNSRSRRSHVFPKLAQVGGRQRFPQNLHAARASGGVVSYHRATCSYR